MKILKESKEDLPIEFITSFVSDGWEKVGILKEEVNAIGKEFKGTKKIEDLINALIDAYLICIGQMEKHLADKDYLDMPSEDNLKEHLTEAIEDEEPTVAKENDGKHAEIHTDLPNFDVDIEEKDEKIKVEVSPKDTVLDELEKDVEDKSDEDKELDAFEAAILAAKPITQKINPEDDDEDEEPRRKDKEPVDFEICDFDEPDFSAPKLTDKDLYGE